MRCPFRSSRLLRPRQQLSEIVVNAGHSEIRLTLKGPTYIMDAVRIVFQELDDGEDEILGLVERVENFVPGHCDGRGAGYAALHFEKA